LELVRLQEAGARVELELNGGPFDPDGWRAIGTHGDGSFTAVEAGLRRAAVCAAIAMASSAEHWPAGAP
jgi:hypothetical protein